MRWERLLHPDGVAVWEPVVDTTLTERLPVPGGYLVRMIVGSHVAMVFVPEVAKREPEAKP